MNFKPTPSQAVALQKIQEFIKKPAGRDFNDRVLVIRGKAGTGKTTIIRHGLDKLIQQDLNYDPYNEEDYFNELLGQIPNVMGVTVSHKAKLRLQESIPNASTYANYFGLMPRYEHDGTIKFEKIKKNPMNPKVYPHELPFIVVTHDEVSMYSMQQIHFLETFTHPSSKIILMGDPNQLPPIVEDMDKVSDIDSPVFFYFTNIVTLEERVRQTIGNPILDLSDEISKEIFGGKDLNRILRLIEHDRFSDGVGYRKIKPTDLIKDYIQHYEKDDQTRVICYRNKRIDQVNSSIRKKMFPGIEDKFTLGDALYLNNTYTNDQDITFFNSQEFKIISMGKKVDYQGIECYRPMVTPFETGSMLLVSEKGMPKYKDQLKKLRDEALTATFKEKSEKWKAFYKFRDTFADVSYGYAFTAYKAQGSGFTNVYVDISDILSTPISDKRKLQTLYTAITRATHQVIFY